MMEPITVAIVDSQPIFRAGLSHTLRESERCSLVAEGMNRVDALRILRDQQPAILLIDLATQGGVGDVLRATAQPGVKTAVIVMTASQNEADLSSVLRAGARGYACKSVRVEQLVEIVEIVQRGQLYTDPTFASSLLAKRYLPGEESVNPVRSLTRRELDILTLVSKGLTNKEIALRHDLAEKTVKHYMTSILQKLRVRNRVEAALLAKRAQQQQQQQALEGGLRGQVSHRPLA